MVLGEADARREPFDPGKAGGDGLSRAPILEMRHIAKRFGATQGFKKWRVMRPRFVACSHICFEGYR